MGSTPVCIGGFRAAHEDRDEFIALGNSCWDLAAIAKAFAGNDFKPDHGFTQLFQRDLHLMNEVFAGFSALSFAIIRRWRGSRPDQLVCDVVASFGIWQSLNNADDDDSKINQSFFQSLRCNDNPIKIQKSSLGNRQSEGCRNHCSIWDFLKLALIGLKPACLGRREPTLPLRLPSRLRRRGSWQARPCGGCRPCVATTRARWGRRRRPRSRFRSQAR